MIMQLVAGCILISDAEVAARLDWDHDGSAWPSDCDDRDATIFPGSAGCGGDEDSGEPGDSGLTIDVLPIYEGEGNFGSDVALLAGGMVLIGAPAKPAAFVNQTELRGRSSCASGGDGAGWSVAAVLDRDGDGLGEALVGAPELGAGSGCAGVVWLADSGIWRGGDVALDGAAVAFEGQNAGGGFGYSVAAVDLDGDGTDEVVVGQPVGNAVHVFQGDTIAATGSLSEEDAFSWSRTGAGLGVAAAGDVDADGVGNVLVTADVGVFVLGGLFVTQIASIAGVGGCGRRCTTGLGDRDGDGRSELAVADSSNVYLLPGVAMQGVVEATDAASTVLFADGILSLAAAGSTCDLPGLIVGESSGVWSICDPPLGGVDFADGVATRYAPESSDASFGMAVAGGVELGLGDMRADVAIGAPETGRVYTFAGNE